MIFRNPKLVKRLGWKKEKDFKDLHNRSFSEKQIIALFEEFKLEVA